MQLVDRSCSGSLCESYVDDDDDDDVCSGGFAFGHLEAVVGRSVGRVVDGRYRGSTVSYRAKRVSCGGCCCYSTLLHCPCGRISSLSLSRQRKRLFLRDADTRGGRLIYHGWTDCLSCRFVDSIATSPGPVSTTGSIRLLEEQVAAYLRDVEAA